MDTLDTVLFTATMKCFNKLIEIIYILSLGNNKSKFEMKYELNDLVVKVFGKLKFFPFVQRLFIRMFHHWDWQIELVKNFVEFSVRS